MISETNPIVMPSARLTIEYGLNDQGEPMMAQRWENLADPDCAVDMLTKAGLLAMAQQNLMAYALGLDDKDEEGGLS